jgi:hypothetical protein
MRRSYASTILVLGEQVDADSPEVGPLPAQRIAKTLSHHTASVETAG